MRPIVIQLQAPARSSFRTELPAGGMADTPDGLRGTLQHPVFQFSAADSWLQRVVSGHSRVNVLVQCSGISVASGFAEMSKVCASAPCVCVLPGDLHLPNSAPRHLMVGDVSALTLPQQLALYDWLHRFRSAVQVVSLTSVPLWPLVEEGRFLEGLFYRLNVVTLAAHAP